MIVFLLAVAHGAAAAADVPSVRPVRRTGPIVPDGFLREADWQRAEAHSGFVIHETTRPAAVQTVFRVLYDDRALYFGIECREPEMGRIVANAVGRDARVWRDDHIEIFLGVADTSPAYYQFSFNANGVRRDSLDRPGSVDPDWDGDWDLAVRRDTAAWTAEAVIYFHGLRLDPHAGPMWRLNVCRVRRASQPPELSTWAHMVGSWHRPDLFGMLGPMEVDFSPFCYELSPPERHSRMEQGVLHTSFDVQVGNRTGRRRDVNVELWLRSPEGAYLIRSTPAAVADGETRRLRIGDFPIERKGEYVPFVLISESPAKAPRLFVTFPAVNVDFVPLRIVVDEPFHRATIYPSEDLSEIRVRVLLEEAAPRGRISVSLRDGHDRTIASAAVGKLRERSAVVSLPCAGLAVGEYRIVARLLGEDGKPIAETEHELRKLPPAPGSEVRVDRNLNLIVNGKPFFPLGWYGGGPRAGKNSKDEVGPNASYTGVGTVADTERALRMLDESLEYGVMIMTTAFPSGRMMSNKSFTEREKRAIIENVRRLKGHPAILAWYLNDEPEGGGATPDALKELYDLISREDPYHPIVICNNSVHGLYSYEPAADILYPDPYPGFVEGGGSVAPLSKVAVFMDNAAGATGGRKTYWICPQAQRQVGRNTRAPTFIEERCMTYLAINHGVKGILYFHYNYIHNNPDLRLGMPFLMREIDRLKPTLLLGSRSRPEAADSPHIDVAAWEHGNRFLLIAVNTEPKETTATLPIGRPGLRHLRVLSEDRVVAVADESLRDRFGPYGVHIYTSDLSREGEDTLADLFEEIAAFRAGLRKEGNVAFGASVKLQPGYEKKSRRPAVSAEYVTDGIADEPGGPLTCAWDPFYSTGALPSWIEIALESPASVGRVVVYHSNVGAFRVEAHLDEGWKTVGEQGDNAGNVTTCRFAPVQTDRLRLVVTRAGRGARVSEIEAFPR